jgi:hypothetical protein
VVDKDEKNKFASSVTDLQNSRQTDLTGRTVPCSQFPEPCPDIFGYFRLRDALGSPF